MRRGVSILVVGILAAASPLALSSPASGRALPAVAPVACSPGVIAAAIGLPTEQIAGKAGAGAVEVRYQCGHAPQLLHLPTPHTGDGFGTSMSSIDWNGDGYADLVIGVPGAAAGSAKGAGAIAIFYGSATGLRFGQLLSQSSAGVPGRAQRGDHFGAAVSTYYAPGDERPYPRRIRIGEPGKNVHGQADAGGFVDLYANWPDRHSREVTLDTAGIPGTAHRGDRLGASLNNDDAVGAPGRTVDGQAGAGAVLEADDGSSPSQLITQATPCMPGVPEAGDHFGAALAGNWIGVPGEDLGSIKDAGMVERWAGGKQCVALTQDTPGVSGTAESGDHFGAALGELYAVDDDLYYQPVELLIGVPGEDTSYGADTGLVNIVADFVDPETGVLSLESRGSTAGPHPHAGAEFGSAIGGALQYEALVGAPGGAGVVYDYRLAGLDKLSVQATYHRATGRPVKNGYGAHLYSLSY